MADLSRAQRRQLLDLLIEAASENGDARSEANRLTYGENSDEDKVRKAQIVAARTAGRINGVRHACLLALAGPDHDDEEAPF